MGDIWRADDMSVKVGMQLACGTTRLEVVEVCQDSEKPAARLRYVAPAWVAGMSAGQEWYGIEELLAEGWHQSEAV